MKINLNYAWNYIDNYKEDYLNNTFKGEEVNIPHTVKEVPYNYFSEKSYQLISTYEKVFEVNEELTDTVAILRFEAFMLKAKIYLNSTYLGEFVSGYIPVEIDVSKVIKSGKNRLLVVLDSNEDKLVPPFGFAVDYLTFGGIYREVSLNIHPKVYLKNIFVHADDKGVINISQDLIGESNSTSITYTLYKGEQLLDRFNTLSYELKDFELWDINNPVLYTLKTVVASGYGEETYYNKFGFRKIEWKNDGFYLNDKKLKLVGLNRHQSFPIIGYAASKSLQEYDADNLKYVAGVNVVRTSHYPQSEHFLNRCDEIGLLVINEIPGWQHIGKEELWRKRFLHNVETMVIEERNHPSLIAHGVRIDESKDDHELYTEANRIAHKLDPYTPTTGVRNFQNSELLEDIYSYNDFSNASLDSIGLLPKKKIKTAKNHPYLVSENMGHMGPCKATSDMLTKREHALRHLLVLNDLYKYKDIVGAIGWCYADYHTHVDFGSGDHICPHGVFDLYRNPKPAYASFASQQDKFPVMEVLSNLKPGDFGNAVFDDIYIVTNCDYVELYKNEEFVNKFYPDFKGKYKYLKHPPIYVDDLVGITFKEDKIPEKHWGKVGRMFSYAAIHGFQNITLGMKLYLARMMMTYKINYDQLLDYWNKYVGSWGGIAKTYTFKGYKDGKVVKEQTLGPSNSFDLEVKNYKDILINEDTYDTTIINLRYVDSFGSLMQYANKVVHIEISGPIELVGEANQALLGGQLSLIIKSKQTSGKAKVKITLENIVKEIEIEVK